ncbi:MAG: magnesium protoporphyrin IX methyltransferase [Phreatobacter sp.]|jgi:magnesium-protoporphyrin O-methyltransferase|nr:magnesium protoporphyrin IX methyltransferase [Phreatobacter sp.]
MPTITYRDRRHELETYFDRTAVDAWARLTSDAPVGGIRAAVRAGRDTMRETLLSWLPQDLTGARILDAGCGTGALAVEAAARGAHVVGVDLSEKLVGLARERTASFAGPGRLDFRVGDLLDPVLGRFDHVVAMDSLIHYRADDMVRVLAALSRQTTGSIVFTFAPRTPLLSLLHAVGRLFPRSDRAPAIEPVGDSGLSRRIAVDPTLAAWSRARSLRVSRSFYISQAMELVRT